MKKIILRITIGDTAFGFGLNGLELVQHWEINPVSFDDAVSIQRAFYDLAEKLAEQFKPTPEQIAAAEEQQRKARGLY